MDWLPPDILATYLCLRSHKLPFEKSRKSTYFALRYPSQRQATWSWPNENSGDGGIPQSNIWYYSFTLLPRFWLFKTTRKIHNNQLLLTKFRENFVILNQWRRLCSPLQNIELLIEETWGRDCVTFGEQENEELIFSFESWKYFE